ncbi:MAG: ATP-binding protein, partial [Flavobacteriales bacterium]
ITNSLKYGFPDERTGEVSISLHKTDNQLTLEVKDNGVGIDNIDEVINGDSFGFGLINAFIKKLKANMKVDGENGTCVVVSLKDLATN